MLVSQWLQARTRLRVADRSAAHAHGEAVQVPNGAYGHFLLGRIAKLTSRNEKAAAHFERCLLLNPMMWSAYEELCALGASLRAAVVCARAASCEHPQHLPHLHAPAGEFDTADRILGAPDACTRPAVPGGAAAGGPRHGTDQRAAAVTDPVLADAMSPLVELRLPGTCGGSVTPGLILSPGLLPLAPGVGPNGQTTVRSCFEMAGEHCRPMCGVARVGCCVRTAVHACRSLITASWANHILRIARRARRGRACPQTTARCASTCCSGSTLMKALGISPCIAALKVSPGTCASTAAHGYTTACKGCLQMMDDLGNSSQQSTPLLAKARPATRATAAVRCTQTLPAPASLAALNPPISKSISCASTVLTPDATPERARCVADHRGG